MKKYSDDSFPHANVFVLRLRLEELGEGHSEWRGQVQKIGSDEVRYFRDWQTMVECVVEMLAENDRISP